MNVAYCSLLLPEEKKLAERSKERLSGVSLHKFSTAIINGIDSNLYKPVTLFNIINTVNYPKFPDIVFPNEKWKHNKQSEDWHIGYINLIGIKYITQAKNLYKKLKTWREKIKDRNCIVCVHHIYFPSMYATYKLKKKFGDRVTICLITGDMNGKYGLRSQYKANLKQYLLKFVENRIDYMAKKFDCFVFATKDMAKAFEVDNKPFVVVECAYTAPPYEKENAKIKEDVTKKTIFYAGALRNEYGISHLLKAFEMINDPDYKLWLAGDGNAVPMIKEYEKKDKRVKYLGFLTPQQVDESQKKATVLINPRIAGNYEYVKYSFPSKTMECLASGKPYIAHKLPCDPPEYADYIQYVNNETDESLKEKIVQICSLTKAEREKIGLKSREFVEKEKNPIKMTKRIVAMWKSIIDEED